MAHFVWVVRVLSPRDGGWVRMFRYFPSEELAWSCVQAFWRLLVLSGDYITVDVVKTIAF